MRLRMPYPKRFARRAGRGCGRAGPWPRAKLALAVLALALAWLPLARASGPLLWVTPMERGAAALASDGTVTLLGPDGSLTPLAQGVRGDSLRRCGGALLAVDGNGHLRSLVGGAGGPAVSPHSRPACLGNGRVAAVSSDARSVLLLSRDLQVLARHTLDALPDGDPTPVGDAVALLTEPTQRYRHGVLGDEIEAGAVTLLSQDDLHPIASYRLDAPAVIEQRRVAPFPAAGQDGMLVTRSTPAEGAGVMALALTPTGLSVLASAPPIGTGNRWSNLFATAGARAYAVRTPHLGGPLERYALVGDALRTSRFALDVTNHVLGSRNLDLGILLPPPAAATGNARTVDVLALPTPDMRTVQLVVCTSATCRPELELSLSAPLSSNLAAAWQDARLLLYAGERDGKLQSFTLDASLWTPSPAPRPVR